MYLVLLIVGVGAAAVGFLLRKSGAARVRVPAWAMVAAVGALLVWGLGFGLMDALGYRWWSPPAPAEPTGPPPLAAGTPEGPLLPGEVLPPVTAEGWLNDYPPEAGAGLRVVDVWSLW